ncbi:hypothetical protein [Sanguibacter antarcticus]|uniref:Uncharacterized protein n=1 Tax=Sanguibacter antarcticus TaxID=372484 RepID=A0A2A9E7N5_9MICO|nr:hypothetical protein [Sanguibacter antarcticus]PFG34853.1 hypothetical protein ATL42_2781 [Sanguibacter antarcticus]
MTLMLTPVQRARLSRKLDGWDDHELVSMRAGDVRALLVEIEATRPSQPMVMHVSDLPASVLARLEATMRCKDLTPFPGGSYRCTLSAVHQVIDKDSTHQVDVSRGDETPRT